MANNSQPMIIDIPPNGATFEDIFLSFVNDLWYNAHEKNITDDYNNTTGIHDNG